MKNLKNPNEKTYDQYMTEVDLKKEEIIGEGPERVIGLVGKCPILESKRAMSETFLSFPLGDRNDILMTHMKHSFNATKNLNSPRYSVLELEKVHMDIKKRTSHHSIKSIFETKNADPVIDIKVNPYSQNTLNETA